MTAEILSAAIRIDGIEIPLGDRETVLADLVRRGEVAEVAARKAETAGDWTAFRRAIERYHLRVLQHSWAEKRLDGARCWKCGELEDGHALSIECLQHKTGLLMARARAMAERDCEGLG